MSGFGLTAKHDEGGKRIEIECRHQSGLIYVVPGETGWVCPEELLHVHALAGFFGELVRLDDRRVKDVMRRWGIYYRERPLAPGSAIPQPGT